MTIDEKNIDFYTALDNDNIIESHLTRNIFKIDFENNKSIESDIKIFRNKNSNDKWSVSLVLKEIDNNRDGFQTILAEIKEDHYSESDREALNFAEEKLIELGQEKLLKHYEGFGDIDLYICTKDSELDSYIQDMKVIFSPESRNITIDDYEYEVKIYKFQGQKDWILEICIDVAAHYIHTTRFTSGKKAMKYAFKILKETEDHDLIFVDHEDLDGWINALRPKIKFLKEAMRSHIT